MDNYATRKTRLIRDRFARRPRRHVHYTPRSASWIYQVERFFALFTAGALRRGGFGSLAELETANQSPRPE
jgi:hypothetical protein